jgi:hypothetical protein
MYLLGILFRVGIECKKCRISLMVKNRFFSQQAVAYSIFELAYICGAETNWHIRITRWMR